MRIAIDIDDTLCDFTSELNAHINNRFGTTYTIGDYDGRSHAVIWNVPPDDAHRVIEEFVLQSSHNLKPVTGAYNSLVHLSSYFELYAMTARDSRLQGVTERWLQQHYPGIFKGVELCNYYGPGDRRRKSDVYSILNVRLAIDDTPDDDKCVVFDRPWNRRYESKYHLRRLHSWKDLTVGFVLDCLLPPKVTIGLSGKLGSGKDTIADIICEMLPSFSRRSFALRVKETVALLTNTTLEMNMSREGKRYIPPGFTITLGQMQQKVGEGLRLLLGEDLWINTVLCDPMLPSRTIVTDCRYKNEAKRIGLTIRINGDPVRIREKNEDNRDLNHSSETDLDDYPFEHVIENDGTLGDLRERVIRTLIKMV